MWPKLKSPIEFQEDWKIAAWSETFMSFWWLINISFKIWILSLFGQNLFIWWAPLRNLTTGTAMIMLHQKRNVTLSNLVPLNYLCVEDLLKTDLQKCLRNSRKSRLLILVYSDRHITSSWTGLRHRLHFEVATANP